MKKIAGIICASVTAMSMALTAAAAPSIGDMIPQIKDNGVLSGVIEDGWKLVIQKVSTPEYENSDVADIIEQFNDDENEDVLTIQQVFDAFKDLEVNQEVDEDGNELPWTTNKDNEIEIEDYEAVTPFVDLVLTNDEETALSYETEDGYLVLGRLEAVKDLDHEDLLIMQIDQKTGQIHFLELEEPEDESGAETDELQALVNALRDEYEPEEGDFIADYPCLGPFAILTRGEMPQGQSLWKQAETEAETEVQ